MLKLTHHGNISVHKLPHICTLHIVKMGEIWVSIELIILKFLHKITCCGYLLESPRGGDSKIYPEHVIVWRNDGGDSNIYPEHVIVWRNDDN